MRLILLLLLSFSSGLMAEEPQLQRITLADGRVLDGVLDEAAGTIQLYNLKTGKPIAVLQITIADITARERLALPKPDDDANPADDAAKPKAKRGADGLFLTNHAAALKLARELKRPVFAFFTGSDWCPACMGMRKEILTTPAFRAWAARSVILLELDFPKKPLDKALKDQNEALKRQFSVSSYPTVHLLNPVDGKSFGSVVSYPLAGPEVYIEQLITRIPAAKLTK